MKISSRLPDGWWKHPTFDWGVNNPAPYIWCGYWLITWGLQDFSWKALRELSIKFLPD